MAKKKASKPVARGKKTAKQSTEQSKAVPPFDKDFEQPKMLEYKPIATIYLPPNDRLNPAELIKKIREATIKAQKAGWINIRVRGAAVEAVPYHSMESYHIELIGDRLETKAEVEQRKRNMIVQWDRELRELQLLSATYSTPQGHARRAAVAEWHQKRGK